MGKPPESKGERAARIFEAADELLAERGFSGVSVRDVAERADVNKALVFYYFGTKDELFGRVLERYYESHLSALTDAFALGGTLGERFHNMMDAYLDFMESNQRYARLVQQHVASTGAYSEIIQRNLRALFEWTEHALSEIAPAQGPLAARHFFVTVSGMVINYYTYAPVLGSLWGGDPTTEEALLERRRHVHWMVDTIIAGLQTEAAARTEPRP